MNNKGFTLVELLATMVILGIIIGMVWPSITFMQDENHKRKYKAFADSMISAAKIYVDSYQEDLFYYDDDLTEESIKAGQCVFISFRDLKEHSLIKDINVSNMSCASNNTFVLVQRKNRSFRYYAYLGCGNINDLENGILPTNKINYIYSEDPADLEGNTPFAIDKDSGVYQKLGCSEPELR